MNRVLKLNLENDLWYESDERNLSELLKAIDEENPGFDSFSKYSFAFDEEDLVLKEIESGSYSGPPTLRIREKREFSSPTKIDKGSYLFSQLPLPSSTLSLKFIAMPFLRGTKEGILYVRLYKESALECVMQLMMPLN